jgi:hypothetical protein
LAGTRRALYGCQRRPRNLNLPHFPSPWLASAPTPGRTAHAAWRVTPLLCCRHTAHRAHRGRRANSPATISWGSVSEERADSLTRVPWPRRRQRQGAHLRYRRPRHSAHDLPGTTATHRTRNRRGHAAVQCRGHHRRRHQQQQLPADLQVRFGTARLVECADATLAEMLAVDPQLRGRCQPAGERGLVFRASEETAVRKALRRLGYILPPGRE